MTTIITLISAGLSVVTPVLFLRLVLRINSSDVTVSRMQRLLVAGIVGWTAIMWLLGSAGVFVYKEGDAFPKFLIALFTPIILFLIALSLNAFRSMVNHWSLDSLVGFQFWRVFGAVFFLVAISETGPYALMGSGYGDILTGTLAIIAYFLLKHRHAMAKMAVWSFMAVGIMDLLVILYILLANYPIWSDAHPSSSIAGSYPMVLIVGIVAPIALIFHILALRKLISPKSQ